jgi:hypothetical protein
MVMARDGNELGVKRLDTTVQRLPSQDSKRISVIVEHDR